ncbi:MAG TPA: BolA family protein [Candidatus Omnitrophota bacterium]|nr:BolA family protein [Candidatus Omnitrophota bacterium]
MITPAEIESMIREAMPDARVTVTDMRGTGDHFEIFVQSALFKDKPIIEQHKMVYAVLKKEMDERIHAVQLKTKAA